MDHLIARIRSPRGSEETKLKKVLSGYAIYELNGKLENILSSFIAYQPDHSLDEGSWFGIEQFSDKNYFLNWLGNPFDSIDYAQLSTGEAKQIDYLCSYQNDQVYCFQKVNKSQYLSRRFFLSIGDNYSLHAEKTFLAVNEEPDAIYCKDCDVLLFRSLSCVSSIFKGIDQLYRVATEKEVASFLNSPFICLAGDFSAQRISKPNLHRISLAADTLNQLDQEAAVQVPAYIQDYCPDLKCNQDAFIIENDTDLKYLLYGIEQRYYTTPFTQEKRIASSVLQI